MFIFNYLIIKNLLNLNEVEQNEKIGQEVRKYNYKLY